MRLRVRVRITHDRDGKHAGVALGFPGIRALGATVEEVETSLLAQVNAWVEPIQRTLRTLLRGDHPIKIVLDCRLGASPDGGITPSWKDDLWTMRMVFAMSGATLWAALRWGLQHTERDARYSTLRVLRQRIDEAAASVVAGALLMVLSVPLTIYWSSQRGESGMRGVLVLRGTSASVNPSSADEDGLLPSKRLALGSAATTGAFGMLLVAMGVATLGGGMPRAALSLSGFIVGTYLTRWVGAPLGLVARPELFGWYSLTIRLLPVISLNLLAHGVASLLGGSSYRREKWDYVCFGTSALATSWLLAEAFGTDSVVFTGGLFLAASFVGTKVIELWFLPMLSIMSRLGGHTWERLIEQEVALPSVSAFTQLLARLWHRRRRDLVLGVLVRLLVVPPFAVVAAWLGGIG